jgi:hypothetical protein
MTTRYIALQLTLWFYQNDVIKKLTRPCSRPWTIKLQSIRNSIFEAKNLEENKKKKIILPPQIYLFLYFMKRYID